MIGTKETVASVIDQSQEQELVLFKTRQLLSGIEDRCISQLDNRAMPPFPKTLEKVANHAFHLRLTHGFVTF